MTCGPFGTGSRNVYVGRRCIGPFARKVDPLWLNGEVEGCGPGATDQPAVGSLTVVPSSRAPVIPYFFGFHSRASLCEPVPRPAIRPAPWQSFSPSLSVLTVPITMWLADYSR
jgi:hypothetical protein